MAETDAAPRRVRQRSLPRAAPLGRPAPAPAAATPRTVGSGNLPTRPSAPGGARDTRRTTRGCQARDVADGAAADAAADGASAGQHGHTADAAPAAAVGSRGSARAARAAAVADAAARAAVPVRAGQLGSKNLSGEPLPNPHTSRFRHSPSSVDLAPPTPPLPPPAPRPGGCPGVVHRIDTRSLVPRGGPIHKDMRLATHRTPWLASLLLRDGSVVARRRSSPVCQHPPCLHPPPPNLSLLRAVAPACKSGQPQRGVDPPPRTPPSRGPHRANPAAAPPPSSRDRTAHTPHPNPPATRGEEHHPRCRLGATPRRRAALLSA